MTNAAKMPEKYKIVAAADPVSARINYVKKISNNPDFKSFSSDKDFFAEEKLSDVVIIGTQDEFHYKPCKEALQKGYNVLLEKPIAPHVEEILELQHLAEKLGRKLQVCYVLRYTPFYRQVKEIINSGAIGDVISINANEGVIPWHQAHSFVRGNWNIASKSSPMIVAKCCHDTDVIGWLIEKQCKSVSSYGNLTHFKKENAPEGATKRCTDGCPHLDTCFYNALKYTDEHRTPWLAQVFDRAEEATAQEIIEWLKVTDFGRCVYYSDNDVVDHQVVSMEFEGNITANLTMTAFEIGRQIEIFGTKGILKGGHFLKQVSGYDIIVTSHKDDNKTEEHYVIDISEDDHHMGGDEGIMKALHEEMSGVKDIPVSSYIQSHIMAYAAEESRLTGKMIDLETFKKKFI
jgi:predicted dehydrogenase